MSPWALPVVSAVIATALWYLASGATLTKALWSRYPPWLDKWAQCPACFGTWATALVAMILDVGWGWTFFGIGGVACWVLAGLWGTFWVSVLGVRLYQDLLSFHGADESETGP